MKEKRAKMRSGYIVVLMATLVFSLMVTSTIGATWPVKQRDMHNTGRADYSIPATRLNSGFFDYFFWQVPTPGDGALSSTQMTFFDGAGPDAADIVTGTFAD